MDISFKTESGKFNYRVCAVITRNGRLLVMKDQIAPYYYLPGGRVKMGEVAEAALRRELYEETGFPAAIIRPLWFCESFFTEELSKEDYHEICLYYLSDLPYEGILPFDYNENTFEWMPFEDLMDAHLYPEFIKKEIYHLPKQLKMIIT